MVKHRDDLCDLILTATAQPDIWLEDTRNFLQEAAGKEIADEIVAFVDRIG